MMAAATIRPNPAGIGIVVLVAGAIVVYTTGFPYNLMGGTSTEEVNLRELLSVSIDLAQAAGLKVKEIREKQDALNEQVKGETKEGAKELKTEGDLQSHRTLMYGFAKAFPNLTVVSEERDTKKIDAQFIGDAHKNLQQVSALPNDQVVPRKDIAVWIDPLDATQEYTENLRKFVTVMVCVAVNGVPTIGVIHKPFSDETFWGWVGKGHSSNLSPADASKAKVKGPYNIIVSRSHPGDVAEVAKTALGEDTHVIEAGGAGYKTLEVITGAADAYVHVTRIKKWDICAGNAIINSVNGKMTNLNDEKVDYHAEGSPANDKGLLATLFNHKVFLKSFKPVFDKEQAKKS